MTAAASTLHVVAAAEVAWGPLNPARGDKGPKAGTLWGDRTAPGPSGFLVEFTDGFESPPHIHNVTYRGVVIRGRVHNDDPDAGEMWMPPGSFWTQPRGAVHITAARGSRNLAYIEIEEGPYLVLPVEEEFDSGEVSINVDESNLVWLNAADLAWNERPGVSPSVRGAKVAFLWGNPRDPRGNGTLLELPAGFTGALRSRGSSLRAVVIQGRLMHRVPGETEVEALDPGSYFGSAGEVEHRVSGTSGEGVLVYVRTEGELEVSPAQSSE